VSTDRRPFTRAQKAALSGALILLALSTVGVGTWATLTGSDSATHTVSTGTVSIALGSTGAATNRLTIDAAGVAPGDTIQRSFDLTNTGSLDLASVTLTSSANPSSLLDTNATDGLQMVLTRCSSAWTESGPSPAFTYACSGSLTTVVASRAVIGSNLSMPGLSALNAGGTDHLRITLTLPSSAGTSFQNLSSVITYTFTGTQRAGTNG
jgi:spore coat-associated protein N